MNKTVIFDMDGTLLYTLDDLLSAVNYALSKNNLPQRTLDEVRAFVGNGVGKLIERALPNTASVAQFNTVFEDFFSYYESNSDKQTRPYDGILGVLSVLKREGFRIAVNSNKYDSAVKSLCKKFFPQVEIAIGAREGIPVKPAPDGVFDIISALQTEKGTTFFIGDSDVDIQTAKNAGITSIGVTWGYRTRDYLVGADYIVDSPKELLDLLLKR